MDHRAGLALSAGETFSSLELSTLFVLSVAEVYWVRLDEIDLRRTLMSNTFVLRDPQT